MLLQFGSAADAEDRNQRTQVSALPVTLNL